LAASQEGLSSVSECLPHSQQLTLSTGHTLQVGGGASGQLFFHYLC
jgi:hypothetical protein